MALDGVHPRPAGSSAPSAEEEALACALRTAREILAAVLDCVEDGVVACDADGAPILANAAALGLASLDDLVAADGPLARALSGERVADGPLEAGDADLPVSRRLVVNARPIHDARGRLLGAVAALRDVTRERSTEAALRVSDSRFRDALDAAPHAVLLTTLEGRVRAANPAALTLFDRPRETLLALDLAALAHPDDAARERQALDELSRGERDSVQLEKRCLRGDGETIWVLASTTLVRDAAGAPLHLVAQLVDVTAAKTAAIRLEQAQRLESVGRLTGGIAHDFNNLLSVILGNLQLLERQLAGDAKADRRIGTAIGAVESAATLTDQLLTFSRRQSLEPRSIGLATLFASLESMLERVFDSGAALAFALERPDLAARCDPVRLESAILNLVLNARDASPAGGAITVAARARTLGESDEAAPGDYVEIGVSDDGEGMPEHVAAKAFEPFFTTKPAGAGAGLGLSMVHGFVKQSGGDAFIDSAPGRGTTVRLLLPAARPEDVAAGASDAAEARAHAEDPTSGGGRVLVVEDDPAVRATACEMLADLGYRPASADTADAALARLQSGETFDAVVTDIVMPGRLDGLALAQKLRVEHPGVALVVTTGYAKGAEWDAERLGEIELVRKPLARGPLGEALARARAKAHSEAGDAG